MKFTPLDLIHTAARDVAKARSAVARKAQPALDKITALGVKFAAQAKGEIERMQSAEQKLFDLVKEADCESKAKTRRLSAMKKRWART